MSEINQPKGSKCRYCHPFVGEDDIEFHCVADGWEDENVKNVSRKDCENCSKFRSKYIEYPITVNSVETEDIKPYSLGHECGAICEIRPCGKGYKDKSYLGIYLGELPICISASYDPNTGVLKNRAVNNPAIFVPELKKIIYGCESWWREIQSVEDFAGISNEDIENTWYLKMLAKGNYIFLGAHEQTKEEEKSDVSFVR